jgi:hypothetical protein
MTVGFVGLIGFSTSLHVAEMQLKKSHVLTIARVCEGIGETLITLVTLQNRHQDTSTVAFRLAHCRNASDCSRRLEEGMSGHVQLATRVRND